MRTFGFATIIKILKNLKILWQTMPNRIKSKQTQINTKFHKIIYVLPKFQLQAYILYHHNKVVMFQH